MGVEHDRPVALGHQEVGETHRGPVKLTRRGITLRRPLLGRSARLCGSSVTRCGGIGSAGALPGGSELVMPQPS
jgi:hypothetical protein